VNKLIAQARRRADMTTSPVEEAILRDMADALESLEADKKSLTKQLESAVHKEAEARAESRALVRDIHDILKESLRA
jgi:hypothetical protein